jgi:hypothetical protein
VSEDDWKRVLDIMDAFQENGDVPDSDTAASIVRLRIYLTGNGLLDMQDVW